MVSLCKHRHRTWTCARSLLRVTRGRQCQGTTVGRQVDPTTYLVAISNQPATWTIQRLMMPGTKGGLQDSGGRGGTLTTTVREVRVGQR